MAGRKPIVSARQLKARVQIIMRATDKDVAQNSEKNRLIDMTESMREAGVLQEFLLDCLRSKLRQDEGQNVAAFRMFEGGHTAHPQQPSGSQIHYQQQHAPVAQSPTYAAPAERVTVDEPVGSLPESHGQTANLAQAPVAVPAASPAAEVEAGVRRYESTPSAIIESVVRGIESAATENEAEFTAPPPSERRRPMGSLLKAMG
jgi:hypothetical protein